MLNGARGPGLSAGCDQDKFGAAESTRVMHVTSRSHTRSAAQQGHQEMPSILSVQIYRLYLHAVIDLVRVGFI